MQPLLDALTRFLFQLNNYSTSLSRIDNYSICFYTHKSNLLQGVVRFSSDKYPHPEKDAIYGEIYANIANIPFYLAPQYLQDYMLERLELLPPMPLLVSVTPQSSMMDNPYEFRLAIDPDLPPLTPDEIADIITLIRIL